MNYFFKGLYGESCRCSSASDLADWFQGFSLACKLARIS